MTTKQINRKKQLSDTDKILIGLDNLAFAMTNLTNALTDFDPDMDCGLDKIEPYLSDISRLTDALEHHARALEHHASVLSFSAFYQKPIKD
jgi:hypothetical protein